MCSSIIADGGEMIRFPNEIIAESVIFDFDGVIVDTEPLHYRAFQLVLEPLGLGFSWESYIETYMGFDDRDAFIEAYAVHGRKVDHDRLMQLIDSKAQLFQQVIQGRVEAYPGVVELIRGLKSEGIPLAISSGALRSDIAPILAALGLADCFDVIVTAEDVARSKPDPESYCLAFARLNAVHGNRLVIQHAVVIEDTPAGIAAARAAGLRVIAVTNSYPQEKLEAATWVTASLEMLLGYRTE